ncbi:hypothetical protein [Kitasatospora cineracea]|uniref:Uncharacterized protein n=1 Tax=Kitasatospora cineracea TaxID=88074 RepID=A0A3N4R2C3_9ACTN|nr:hypothetical protein [Kitasatospora cineracea]RPE27230.1 hypothetical protein EDD38_7374 [Kitasatospora cineracea]RPE27362.1 hypothetical protein EDD38_7507 [Kitasatospora cineracea]
MLPFRLSLPEPAPHTAPAPEAGARPGPAPADLDAVLDRIAAGTSTTADADTLRTTLTALQRQSDAARAFADEMAHYCSPHNLAATYAQRLTERLDAAGNLQPAHHA